MKALPRAVRGDQVKGIGKCWGFSLGTEKQMNSVLEMYGSYLDIFVEMQKGK